MHEPTAQEYVDYTWSGVGRALLVVASWAALLGTSLFAVDLSAGRRWVPVLAVPALTFLYVGLFITAHDAMHRTLAPRHPRLNDFLGRACVFLYALFSYAALTRCHLEHHSRPASAEDPDYHSGSEKFWPWYLGFMFRYMTWRQWLGMPAVFWSLHWLGAPLPNVFLFWVAPSLLSSVQLFYFGTYLPHRTPTKGFQDHHRAISNGYSKVVSFLTCYHFGRHWEHHAWPFIPWWKLGGVRTSPAKREEGRFGTSVEAGH